MSTLASVSGTYVVQLFTGNTVLMFLAPCALGGLLVLLFAATLHDRRLDAADRPRWSLRELAGSFYVNPWRHPDFSWAFASRFLFVLAYAFLTTYQVFFLLEEVGWVGDGGIYRCWRGLGGGLVRSIVVGRIGIDLPLAFAVGLEPRLAGVRRALVL